MRKQRRCISALAAATMFFSGSQNSCANALSKAFVGMCAVSSLISFGIPVVLIIKKSMDKKQKEADSKEKNLREQLRKQEKEYQKQLREYKAKLKQDAFNNEMGLKYLSNKMAFELKINKIESQYSKLAKIMKFLCTDAKELQKYIVDGYKGQALNLGQIEDYESNNVHKRNDWRELANEAIGEFQDDICVYGANYTIAKQKKIESDGVFQNVFNITFSNELFSRQWMITYVGNFVKVEAPFLSERASVVFKLNEEI